MDQDSRLSAFLGRLGPAALLQGLLVVVLVAFLVQRWNREPHYSGRYVIGPDQSYLLLGKSDERIPVDPQRADNLKDYVRVFFGREPGIVSQYTAEFTGDLVQEGPPARDRVLSVRHIVRLDRIPDPVP